MKIIYLSILSVGFFVSVNARAQQMTVGQQMGLAAERSSRAQDTMAQVEVARFQREEADRAAKIADEIRQAALAAQAAREARDADLEKEIERCLLAGLPTPTEATWRKPTAYEEERAKFSQLMRERMSARLHQEYSSPRVSDLSELIQP